ncbi:TadE/TadG family type IV pilus assembly protein [Phenylobacterium sp.]|uniref:TadE/TadG family type IV pilus assembly protein n=1 Tax=Phenylobacterium sp. TaxID=1871053 RepID=UPI002F91FBFA
MVRLRTDLRRLARDKAGASAVEFALVAPVLCMVAAGTVDAGRYIARTIEVNAAAQAGADYAKVAGWNAAGIAGVVRNAAKGSVTALPAVLSQGCAVSGAIVAPSGARCPEGDLPGRFVTVRAQTTFTPLAPWPAIPLPSRITADAQVRIP